MFERQLLIMAILRLSSRDGRFKNHIKMIQFAKEHKISDKTFVAIKEKAERIVKERQWWVSFIERNQNLYREIIEQ